MRRADTRYCHKARYCTMLRKMRMQKLREAKLRKELEKKLQVETETRKEAEREAVTDPITGAYNYRILEQKYQEVVSELERYGFDACLLFLDIDDFKKFNSDYGQKTGDAVLHETVAALRGTLRPYDIVAKIGGEDFVVVLPKINLVNKAIVHKKESMANAYAVAERMRKRVEGMRVQPYGAEGKVSVTVSIGVALLSEAKEMDGLIDNANKAERGAKEAGKNRSYVFYEGRALEKLE